MAFGPKVTHELVGVTDVALTPELQGHVLGADLPGQQVTA
jgi:hypothetical protein